MGPSHWAAPRAPAISSIWGYLWHGHGSASLLQMGSHILAPNANHVWIQAHRLFFVSQTVHGQNSGPQRLTTYQRRSSLRNHHELKCSTQGNATVSLPPLDHNKVTKDDGFIPVPPPQNTQTEIYDIKNNKIKNKDMPRASRASLEQAEPLTGSRSSAQPSQEGGGVNGDNTDFVAPACSSGSPGGPQWATPLESRKLLFLTKKRVLRLTRGYLWGVFISFLKCLCKQASVFVDIARKDNKKIGIGLNPRKP